MLVDQIEGAAIETEPGAAGLGGQPCAPLSAARRAGLDDASHLLDRVEDLLRHGPAAADQHERRGRQRVGEVAEKGAELVGAEAADAAGDHHAALDEERRRLGGVDDGRHLVVLAGQVVDGEHRIGVTHELVHESAHGVTGEDGVVAPDEVRGHGRVRHHPASWTAASTSHTRRVPFTSWVRTMRHPNETPMAAAASDASPRSWISRSRARPRNVLLDADNSSG